MNQIFFWLGGSLSVIYGALTAFAGYGLTKRDKIQVWAAWSFVLSGVLVIASGVLTLFRFNFALWILVIALIGIHVLAINNGLRLFGKINRSHHVARLIVSVILVALTFLGLR